VLGARVGFLPSRVAQNAFVEWDEAIQPERADHVAHPVPRERVGDLAVAARVACVRAVAARHAPSFKVNAYKPTRFPGRTLSLR
jgi:hypothetical protein